MKISKTTQAVFENLLKDLVEKAQGLEAATISSIDGFQIAAVLPESKSVGKMAAMSSSLHALGHAIAREAKRGTCRQLVVQSTEGCIVVLEIPQQNPPLLLNLITQNGIDLSRLLEVAELCAERLAAKLELTK